MLNDYADFDSVVSHITDILNCFDSDADQRLQDLRVELLQRGWSKDAILNIFRAACNNSRCKYSVLRLAV